MFLWEVLEEIWCLHVQDAQTALEEAMASYPALDARRLRRGTKTGVLITVMLSTVNGTELGNQDCIGVLFLRYGIDSPDLHPHCDGFNTKFSICNVLDFKKGFLITTCRNKLCDRVADIEVKAFIPLHMRDDPLINPGFDMQEVKSQPVG